MKLSSVFTHWNHKKQYLKDYEKLLKVATDKQKQTLDITTGVPAESDLTLDQRIKKLREILLSLNLRDAQDIPWATLTQEAKDLFSTEGTIRAVMLGYGTYKKRKTAKYFKDIVSTSNEGKKIFRKPESVNNPEHTMICPECKNVLVAAGYYLKCNKCGYIRISERVISENVVPQILDTHTPAFKTKTITEPIKTKKTEPVIIDDDSMKLWKYRDQRAEQVRLMKDLVEQSGKQTGILVKLLESNPKNEGNFPDPNKFGEMIVNLIGSINKNTEASLKWAQSIESARVAAEKKSERVTA